MFNCVFSSVRVNFFTKFYNTLLVTYDNLEFLTSIFLKTTKIDFIKVCIVYDIFCNFT